MADPTSRRNFLRGRFSTPRAVLRPPWALAEQAFVAACTRCGDCRVACPTRIVGDSGSGYPAIDFTAGECTFCATCVSACTTGALQRVAGQAPWGARATIGERCLAWQRVECRICGDLCVAGAIRFCLQQGGSALPMLDTERCTGCGACVAPCPTQAIVVADGDRGL